VILDFRCGFSLFVSTSIPDVIFSISFKHFRHLPDKFYITSNEVILCLYWLTLLNKVIVRNQSILKLVKMASNLLSPLSKTLRSMQVLTSSLRQFHNV
jgi:hypothetical protein